MIKRYQAGHWGVLIPFTRSNFRRVWDPSDDIYKAGHYRKHFCVTFMTFRWSGFREFRLRVGVQYL